MPTEDSEATPRSRNARWAFVYFLGVGAIALALRSQELGSKGLWLDEAYSVLAAQLPLGEMLAKLSREATPPLYYLCLMPWVQLFGNGEAAARALSLVFSIGGIALMGWLTFRFFSLRVASVVTLMLAFMPLHVYYAQEARMYSLLALLGAALVFASLEFLARRSRGALLGVALFSLLMLLTHNVAGWFVAGVNVAFFSLCQDRRTLLRWLVAQCGVALCYAPWLSVVLEQVHEQRDVLAWFASYWDAKSVVGHFMTSIGTFALGSYPPYLAIQSPLSTAPFLRSGVLLLMGLGLFRWRRDPSVRFIGMTLCVAMTLSLGYSALYYPIHIPGRTDHAFLPFFVLLLALGVDGIKPRIFEAAVLLVGMIGSLAILQIYHDYPAKNDSRTYLWELQANLNPGDIVITTGLTWAETGYYLERWKVPVSILAFPKNIEEHPGYINYGELMRNPARLYADAEELTQLCKSALGPDNAIFLVYLRPLNVNGILAERLLRDFPNVLEIGTQPFRQSVLNHGVRIVRMQAENDHRPSADAYP